MKRIRNCMIVLGAFAALFLWCDHASAIAIMRDTRGPMRITLHMRPLSLLAVAATPNNLNALAKATGRFVVIVMNKADNIVQAQGFDNFSAAEDYYIAQVLKGNGQKLLKTKIGKRRLKQGVVVPATASMIQ